MMNHSIEQKPETESANKWPKHFPPLTPEQAAIRQDFMKRWHEVLPARYGAIEQFNHTYPLRSMPHLGQVNEPIRTLEVGAGLGAHIEFEALSRQEYHALELRANMAAVLKKRFPQVTVVVGDIEQRTDYPEAYFQRIVAVHVLEHLCNLPAALQELKRLLAPGGVLSVVLPCEGGWAYSLARRISAQRLFEQTYKQPYDWFIQREHVNTFVEVKTELLQYFQLIHERRWPLWGLPVTLNLVIGLTLRKE